MPKVTTQDGVYKIIHVGSPLLSRLRVNRALDTDKLVSDPDQLPGQFNGVRWLIEAEIPGQEGPINGWFPCHSSGNALFFIDPDKAVAQAEKLAQKHISGKAAITLGQVDAKPQVKKYKEATEAVKNK